MYGGRKFFDSANNGRNNRIRPQNRSNNQQKNFFQPSNAALLPNPGQFQPVQVPFLGNVSNMIQRPFNSMKRIIKNANRNIQGNNKPKFNSNINFNNGPSTSSKGNNSQNMKRGHNNVVDLTNEQAPNNKKRHRSPGAEPDDIGSKEKYSKLTEQVETYANLHSQSEDMLDKKLKLRSALLCMIQQRFPGVTLHLVGSSCNGFASNSSDADFCIMITHKRNVNQKHEARFYLKTVEQLVRPIRSLRGLQVIPAKVPILKFKDMISGCECDININNHVGIRNTHLLRTYSKVDHRIQPMVMALKKWAKSRNINDASQGTLNSYSLVLMVIHYLQYDCKPPVIPSLQLAYPQHFRPDSNVDDLPMFEPANYIPCNQSDNNQSVGELIEGFFRYFSCFSWDKSIMSIRLGNIIPKKTQFEFKNKYISIEEPFELTNTARAVHDSSKFSLIKKEIQRAALRLKDRLSLDYITS